MLIKRGFFPFATSVMGFMGCPQQQDVSPPSRSAARVVTDAPAASGFLGAPRDIMDLSGLPRGVMNAIGTLQGLCEPDMTPGISTAYARGDAMTLWQVPCQLFAAQGSSVFALTLNDMPQHAGIISFASPPGEGSDHFDLMQAHVDAESGIITGISLGRDDSCGTYERHQLVVAEGETLETELIEYREKVSCDGRSMAPDQFPLVYRR